MKRALKIAGYTWAAACVVIVIATFAGNDYFSGRLASATGVTISPWYSGGEIVRSIDHGAYRTLIRRPVFDGLIGERKEGFIQIEWQPVTALPPVIEDGIDYTGDGKEDFSVPPRHRRRRRCAHAAQPVRDRHSDTRQGQPGMGGQDQTPEEFLKWAAQ